MEYSDWMAHHGIKGMRWGIRRTAEELGHVPDNANKGLDALSRLTRKKKSENKAADLSDDELRRRVSRLNLEAQYNKLTSEKTRRGWDVAKDILAVVGSVSAITATGLKIYSISKGEKDDQ